MTELNTTGVAVTGLAGPYLRQYNPTVPVQLYSTEIASVLFFGDGRRFTLWPDGWRPARPPRLRKPFAVVEVALGRHRTDFTMALPAAGSAAFFRAGVEVVWEVVDAERVALTQLRDITVPLRPELEQRLRDITLRYPIRQVARANEAIRAELTGPASLSVGAELGLRIALYVRLDLDDMAIAAATDIRSDEYEAELFGRRTGRMQQLFAAGDFARAAALAQEPGGLAAAIQMLNEESRTNQRQTIDFAKYMIDAGLLEPHQLDRQTQAILSWVRQSVDPLLPAGNTAVPQLAGPPAEPTVRRARWEDEDDEPPQVEARPAAASDPWDDEPPAPQGPEPYQPEPPEPEPLQPLPRREPRHREEDPAWGTSPWDVDDDTADHEPARAEPVWRVESTRVDGEDPAGGARGGRWSDAWNDWGQDR